MEWWRAVCTLGLLLLVAWPAMLTSAVKVRGCCQSCSCPVAHTPPTTIIQPVLPLDVPKTEKKIDSLIKKLKSAGDPQVKKWYSRPSRASSFTVLDCQDILIPTGARADAENLIRSQGNKLQLVCPYGMKPHFSKIHVAHSAKVPKGKGTRMTEKWAFNHTFHLVEQLDYSFYSFGLATPTERVFYAHFKDKCVAKKEFVVKLTNAINPKMQTAGHCRLRWTFCGHYDGVLSQPVGKPPLSQFAR